MASDKSETLQNLKDSARQFREARGWGEFHDPKNLAEAISIEASELQELFLWKDKKDIIEQIKSDSKFKERVEEEVADVLIFLLHFANAANIDLSSAVYEKTKKNAQKYPVEKSKGNATKYTQL